MNLIRSISGIRGIIGQNFSPSIASEYAKSFCSIQSDTKPLIIARDTRNQGHEIVESIKEEVTSLGRDIYDIDFVAGGTFAIDGHQERIGESIFLFAPSSVTVTNSFQEEASPSTVVNKESEAVTKETSPAPTPEWGESMASAI